MFTDEDIRQIEGHGLTVEKVVAQIENFRRGFGFLPVEGPATVGNGINVPSKEEAERYADLYSRKIQELGVVKFVPASGAATRMFKDLFEYLSGGRITPTVERLVADMEKFAFYDHIKDKAGDGSMKAVARAVIEYGAALPKALILFHKYPDGHRTAMDEHLAEGAAYAAAGGRVRIHFTIPQEHARGFEERAERGGESFGKMFGVDYDISFSHQNSGTDTIAVTPDNEPFRERDGRLLFRPAGHGALLENLNAIDADIIFIKNIDNVTPDRLKADTALYKKALGGMLVSLQERIFGWLETLDSGASGAEIGAMKEFINDKLSYKLPEGFGSLAKEEKEKVLRSALDRPLRICGMVRNDGEPGGGPFRVKNPDGSVSLQIAESSQISPGQKHLLNEGTHFNPVDLVCGVRDYRGNKFDLTEFSDPSTGFISEKTKDGRKLRAQELPGLWNGAMAGWSTVFVEVPVSTFTPVKEAGDLLRPQHQ